MKAHFTDVFFAKESKAEAMGCQRDSHKDFGMQEAVKGKRG